MRPLKHLVRQYVSQKSSLKENKNLVFRVLYIVQISYRALLDNLPSFAPFMMETLLFGTKNGDSSNTSRTCGTDLSLFN